MELNEEGVPIIPEDLKKKPQTEWTYEDWERSGGSGRAEHTVGPLEVAAGAVIAPGLVGKAVKAWGVGTTLDAGMQMLFPDAEDTKLEQALDFNKPIKTGIKATRLMYERVLKDADVYSKSRFSSRLKREAGKEIINEYLHDKAAGGPYKNWQDQGIPQTQLSSDISDIAKRTDAQFQDPLGTPRKKPDYLVRSELGSQLGFKRQADGQFVFSWNQLKTGSKKLGNASYWRRKGATYFTSPPNKADFTKYREANIDAFLDEWEPYLKLDPMYESRKQFKRYIDLHHITPLTISAPLFDNLVPHSDEYNQLFSLLKENFLTPGDMEKNFFLTLKRPHQLLHDKFYVDTIGKQGEKFFTPARMKLLNSGPDGRLAVAKEYIKTIKDGEGIIKDAMNYLSLVYRTNKEIPPEELVEQLTKLPYSPKYRLRDMDKMVREIIEQYDVKKTLFKDKPTTKPKENLSKKSQRERWTKDQDIEDELRGMERQKRRNKKKPNDPDQLNLDDLFPDR